MKAKRQNLAALLCILCLGACVAAPASAVAQAPLAESAMELVFAGGNVKSIAGQLGVPVRCFGSSRGFCSGTVTLSSGARHSTSTFSVPGGAREMVFVPLRLDGPNSAVAKVHGVATTAQRLGPPRSVESYLRVG